MQRTLEVNPPVYYTDDTAAKAASRNLSEEIGTELGQNMKVNMDIRKILWLPVEYKDFRSDGSSSYMQEILVTYKQGDQPQPEL